MKRGVRGAVAAAVAVSIFRLLSHRRQTSLKMQYIYGPTERM